MIYPACPICGSKTIIRINRKLQKNFFGCINFPRCKGNLDIFTENEQYEESSSSSEEYDEDDYEYDDIYRHHDQHKKPTHKENKMIPGINMNNIGDKLMGRFFKKVDGVVWDLMSGKVGIHTKEGISTLEGEGDAAQVNLNMIDQFGMPIPAFAQSTPVDSVKIGDLIYVNGSPKGWVISIKEPSDKTIKKFVIMNPNGSSGTWTPPKVSMLGFESGVMVLKSLTEMLPGGKTGLDGMQANLMPLLMMGGDFGDFDQIIPMLLMSQMGMGGAGAGAGNMMQMMLMMKMLGGKKGSSGKSSFFD